MDVNTSLDNSQVDPFGFRRGKGASRVPGSYDKNTPGSNIKGGLKTTSQQTVPETESTSGKSPRNVSLHSSYANDMYTSRSDIVDGDTTSNQPLHYFPNRDTIIQQHPHPKENDSPRRSNVRRDEVEVFTKHSNGNKNKNTTPLYRRMPIMTNSFGEEVSPLRQESPGDGSESLSRRSLPPMLPQQQTQHQAQHSSLDASRRQTFVSSSSTNSNANHRNSSASTSQLRFQVRQYQQQLQAAQDSLETAERKHNLQVQSLVEHHNQELLEWQERYHRLQNQRHEEVLEKEQQFSDREGELKRREALLRSQQDDWHAFQEEEADRLNGEYSEKEEELYRQLNERDEALKEFEKELRSRQAKLTMEEEEIQARMMSWQKKREQEENNLQQKMQDLLQREQQVEKTNKDNESLRRKLQQYRSQLEDRFRQIEDREQEMQSAEQNIAKRRSEVNAASEEIAAKNASYEAKYGLVEEALKDLAERREEEETRLEEALREQEAAAQWIETVKKDADDVKKALRLEMEGAHSKYESLKEQIVEQQEILSRLKERIQIFLSEDRKSRNIALEREADARRELEEVKTELSEAREEFSDLRHKINSSNAELSKLRDQIFREREQWETEKEDLLKNKIEDAEAESRRIFQKGAARFQQMIEQANQEREQAIQTINERSAQIDSLRETLEKATRSYEEKCTLLRKDQEATNSIQQEYKEKLMSLKKSESDAEWEFQRLKSLRESAEKRVRQVQLELESLKDEHQIELQTLAEQLATVESERDELSAIVREKEQQFDGETDNMMSYVSDLEKRIEEQQNQVKESQSRAEDAEAHVKYLKSEKETVERERGSLTSMMDQVEKQVFWTEQRQAELNDERKRLADLQDRLNEEETALKLEKQRVAELDETVLIRHQQFEADRTEFEQRTNAFAIAQQKALIRQFFDRPLRRDMESISAAFSKWVRVAMFGISNEYANEEADNLRREIEILENKLADMARNEISLQEKLQSSSISYEELQGKQHKTEEELRTLQESASDLKVQLGETRGENRLLEEELESLRREKYDTEEQHQSLDFANKRIRKITQELHAKKVELAKKEAELTLKEDELAEKEASNRQEREMQKKRAMQLSEKAEAYSKSEADLERRMIQCKQLEVRLRQLETYNERNGS